MEDSSISGVWHFVGLPQYPGSFTDVLRLQWPLPPLPHGLPCPTRLLHDLPNVDLGDPGHGDDRVLRHRAATDALHHATNDTLRERGPTVDLVLVLLGARF